MNKAKFYGSLYDALCSIYPENTKYYNKELLALCQNSRLGHSTFGGVMRWNSLDSRVADEHPKYVVVGV